MRTHKLLLVAVFAMLPDCVFEARGGTSSAVCGGRGQGCCAGATCSAGLACAGGVCTTVSSCGTSGAPCCAGATCAAGLACAGGVCTTVSSCGTSGAPCCAGATCAAGLVCGTAGVCGVAATETPRYSACTPGQTCAAGTACQPAMYTTSGGTGNLCTAMCTRGEHCPASTGTMLPTCVVSATTGIGVCYQTCVSNVDCVATTQCARIPGTTTSVCLPVGAAPVCGATGQSCCAGNACNAGLTCTSGVCAAALGNRRPYAKCDVAAGDICDPGTVCVASIAQVAGKTRGSACTAACPTGLDSSCPGYVPGAASQSVVCANLTGTLAQAQCFRRCTTQNDCVAFNTTCTGFSTTQGELRVCVPAGPRP